jgi:hypothetical protein
MNMIARQHRYLIAGIGIALAAVGAQAQAESTMVILPDAAADSAVAVTQYVELPEAASGGQETARGNRDGEGENGAEAALAEAQANAADAADYGLQTAMDAIQGNREELGRRGRPEDLPIPQELPDQVPDEIPAGPDGGLPEGNDLPTPPTPQMGG